MSNSQDDPFIPAAPADVQPSEEFPAVPTPVLAMPSLVVDRVTVVDRAHLHQVDGGPDVSVESRFSRPLKSNGEQPFYRRYKVGPQWRPVERGHLERCSYLMVSNREGMNLQRIPTPEERAAIDSRVVELSFKQGNDGVPAPHVEVPPGESVRVRPCDIANVLIRCRRTAVADDCRQNEAMVELNIFPE